MAAWLSQRSTILSTFSASAINYSTLSGSAITLNSTMISLGTSTNSVYTRLSQGNFNSSVSTSSWVSSLTNRVSTTTVAMSANAQYQLALSQSSISTSVMFTSTLGSSWSTLSGATGLPSATTTVYSAGAISGDSRYGVLGTTNGQLFVTANAGQSFSGLNTISPTIYLPLDTVPANGSSSSGTSPATLTVAGPPTQAPSYVMGTGAVRLTNTINGTATQYIQGPLTFMPNYTITLWFNTQSIATGGYQIIYGMYSSALQIYLNGTNQLGIVAGNGIAGGTFVSPFTNALTINTWYNVTVSYQTGGNYYFYLNNSLISSGPIGPSVAYTSNKFSIGIYDNWISGTSYPFNGYIDDVKIYNTAIPFTPMYPPHSFTSTAVSNSGQYMLATMANQGLYMSSNFGGTFSPVTGVLLNALWSNAQVSATGQYMLVNAQPQIVQPQLSGLSTALWQTNGISWTASASTSQGGTTASYLAFNNTVGSNNTWASAGNYIAGTGAYNGTTSTTFVNYTGGAITGEWLQIQSSAPIIMYSYSFANGGNAGGNQAPRIYQIVGSNDGTIWYPIQSVTVTGNPYTAVNTYTNTIIVNSPGTIAGSNGSSYAVTTTIYTTGVYLYFRLCVNATIPGSFSAAELGEWLINFQAGGQTYSTNYGATWSNQPALYSQQMLMPGPTAASITYPSTTLALSESGQYALSAMVSNPVLLGELNFEGTYADTAPTPTLTYVGNQGGGSNISLSTSQAKVGTSSLYSTNVAGATSSLTYANYTLPAFFNGATAYTISTWLYPAALPASSAAVPYHLTNSTFVVAAYPYINTNGTIGLAFYTTTSGAVALGITTTTIISINTWTHLVIMFASGIASIYINGVLCATGTYTGTICLANNVGVPTNLIVGAATNAYGGYNGFIDNLRIYNSALTPQQIQTIYANNVSSTTLTQISPSFSVSPQQTGLTANTWNQGGINWTSNSSSVVGPTFQSWLAFNNVAPANGVAPSYSWASATTYNGTYNGSVSTTIQSIGPYLGEWIQIQSSVPIVIYSYNFACGAAVNIPKNYYIVGSNDGSIWYPIQLVSIGTNPFTAGFTSATSPPIIVNQSGSQTMIAGTSGTLTCTTYTTNTTAAYTYFRFIANTVFPAGGNFEFIELYLNFTGPTNTSLYNVVSPLTGLSTNTYTSGTIPGAITNSAISNTGQYMVVITNNTTGSNVYYSTNYGATFTGLQLGTSVLTSCAMSYDGSYMTIASGATVYTLNNNSTGFSVALGNQAGYQNQANNAIAIGNYAGYQNQTANSIILNASGPGALGTGLNAVTQGFYVAPIASYTTSSSQTFALLGYGTDSQITQGIGSISTTLLNMFIGSNAGSNNTTGYQNMFIGGNAGSNNTTGYGNVYIGQNVGILNTTGFQNVGIGQSTGYSITTAFNNTIVGANSGQALTTGYNNSFFGTAAGQYTTTGNQNTFIGVLAGSANITGGNNICIGKSANTSSSSSTNEIVIGTDITGSGSNTVKIGCGTNVVGTTITFFNNVTYTSMPTYSNVTLQASNATYNMGYISFLKSDLGGAYMNIGLANTNNVQQAYLMLLPTNATASILQPAEDNVMSLGGSSRRFVSVFAVNGAIQTSDSNEKNLTILPYGLNELLQMRTIMYKWKSQDSLPDTDPTKHYKYYGLCADQLAAILPELVYDDDPTTPIQMNYSEIIPICVKAIQEQHAEITTLKQQIVDMASQLATLTQRLVNAGIA